MGRPLGSKNKPKVTDTAVVTEKPVKKVSMKEASSKALSTLADIEKGLEADRKEEADEEEPSDEPVEGEPVKKHRGIKQKKMAEQIEWIFEELKNLRNYIQRIDEARLNLPKNESVIPNTDVVSKRKRRIKPQPPSTNEDTEKEKVNETEIE
jgi:hypothetical protein